MSMPVRDYTTAIRISAWMDVFEAMRIQVTTKELKKQGIDIRMAQLNPDFQVKLGPVLDALKIRPYSARTRFLTNVDPYDLIHSQHS